MTNNLNARRIKIRNAQKSLLDELDKRENENKITIEIQNENDEKNNVNTNENNNVNNEKKDIEVSNITLDIIDEIVKQIISNFEKNKEVANFCGWDDSEITKTQMDTNDPNLFTEEVIMNADAYKNSRINKVIRKDIIQKNIGESGFTNKPVKKKIDIEVEIASLDDLIKLTDEYQDDSSIEYNINIHALHKIKPSLIELNNMIGNKSIKENVVDQILYFMQGLHKTNQLEGSGDFMHTVICGPPGTGKTEIAKIMGKIFSKMGVLKNDVFKKVTRSDLIAGYLGQTAIKTRDVITECLGGCLFIDEAYALGNSEKRDSFSKECIDTLCEALSHHKDNLMVIIAGYEKELNECFFAYNQGLDSRFIWRFKTDDYKGEELYKIFVKKVGDCGWSLEETNAENKKGSNMSINVDWFHKNIDYFKFYGRDIETLLSKTKIAHSRRVFCRPNNEKKKITFKDLEKGFEMFLKNDEVKNRKEVSVKNYLLNSIYV